MTLESIVLCGIAGYFGRSVGGLLSDMVAAVRHRGPDGTGEFVSGPVHFGHTRLAIIDLVTGDQPMVCDNQRLAVTYNGEIYNYLELRPLIEARGLTFETTSDTEVIPLGYRAFGRDFFKSLIGIFAFALADFERRKLFLVRDHFGVKPLYYSKTTDGIVFSSCARAVALHPAVDRSINPNAVRDFLQFRYVPNGDHFFAGIESVPPGTILEYDFDGAVTLTPYWTPRRREPTTHPNDWVEQMTELLDDAIRIQLRSDVPVGLFLSGGVDSSTIATFAARHAAAAMTAYTFAIDGDHDETDAAAVIAKAVGAEHRIVHGSNGDRSGLSRLAEAVSCMDIPVGDAIIVPTYQLCEVAGADLKVVLTGEGADEIFGGYVHFGAILKLVQLGRSLGMVNHLAGLVHSVPIALLNLFFDYQASLGRLGRRKLAKMVASIHEPTALYRLASGVIDDDEIQQAANLGVAEPASQQDVSLSGLMLETVKTWLPNQILNKMDQLSMAHGLEARVPFLDPRIYDMLSTAPDSCLISGGQNKRLLRNVLARVGGANADRRKFAFHVPVEQTYRHELETLCQEWLSPGRVARHGILRMPYVERNIEMLRKGEFLASKRLVTMACLHMWLEGQSQFQSARAA